MISFPFHMSSNIAEFCKSEFLHGSHVVVLGKSSRNGPSMLFRCDKEIARNESNYRVLFTVEKGMAQSDCLVRLEEELHKMYLEAVRRIGEYTGVIIELDAMDYLYQIFDRRDIALFEPRFERDIREALGDRVVIQHYWETQTFPYLSVEFSEEEHRILIEHLMEKKLYRVSLRVPFGGKREEEDLYCGEYHEALALEVPMYVPWEDRKEHAMSLLQDLGVNHTHHKRGELEK